MERVFVNKVTGARQVETRYEKAELLAACSDLLVEVTGLSDRQAAKKVKDTRDSEPLLVDAITAEDEAAEAAFLEETEED